MANEEIKIGFWNNSANSYPEYPMPEEEGQYDNTKLVKKLEHFFEEGVYQKRHVHYMLAAYRGISPCRLCKSFNGSEEHEVTIGKKTYYIPAGYIHYLHDHKIKPDPMVYQMLEEAGV